MWLGFRSSVKQSVVPQTTHIISTWELVRNANYWASPQTHFIRNSESGSPESVI